MVSGIQLLVFLVVVLFVWRPFLSVLGGGWERIPIEMCGFLLFKCHDAIRTSTYYQSELSTIS